MKTTVWSFGDLGQARFTRGSIEYDAFMDCYISLLGRPLKLFHHLKARLEVFDRKKV